MRKDNRTWTEEKALFDDFDIEEITDDECDDSYEDEAEDEDEDEDEDDGAAWWFKPLGIICALVLVILVLVLAAVWVVRHNNGFNIIVPESEETESAGTNPTEETEGFEEPEEGTEKENDSIFEDSISKNSVSENDTSSKSKPGKQPTETATSSKMRKPIKVTVKINNIKSVYGATIPLSYEVEGVDKEKVSKYIVLTKAPGNNVGTYDITGTCNAPNLYDVTFISGKYTIIPREVTIQADDKESFVGEKLKDLTYTVSKGSIVKGDKVVSLSTNADASKVGTYKIEGKCINSNYNLTVKVGKYTIKAKGSSSDTKPSDTKPISVTVKIDNKESYYGDKIVSLSFSVTKGDVNKEELSKYITLTKASGKDVGNYKITGKCTDTGKYNVTFTDGTYTIKARKLSISVDNKESFVGEELKKLTYSVKSGSVIAGDDVVDLSTNADPTKVGTYDITAKSKSSNYDVTIANKGVYTVKEKPAKDITIQIESKTSTYGDSIVGLDFSIAGGDVTKAEIAPYITLSKEGDNNVGNHRITGTCSDTGKYNVTFIEGTYTINPRSISVKADDKQTYEGDPLADLTYTLTSGSIVNGDDVISLSSNATPSAVGEHLIVVECKNSNYVLQSENGTYRVKAKPQPPKDDEEEVGGETPSGPSDDEESVEPNNPTPSAPKESEETVLIDEGEEVQPSAPTP